MMPKNASLLVRALSSPSNVLAMLGSLWSRTYTGRNVLLRVVQANLELHRQHHQDLEEAVACLDRQNSPIYHTENWTPIRLRSEVAGECSWSLPAGIVGVPILQNRIASPSVVLFEGLDYRVVGSKIGFKTSPFADTGIPQTAEIRPGVAPVRELTLWAFKAKHNRQYIQRHFGVLADFAKPTNMFHEKYPVFVNAIIDVMSRGTSTAAVKAVVAMLHGVPVITSPVEVVQDVCETRTGPLVLTDMNVYQLPPWASAAVRKGQELRRGTPLVDACVVVDPHRCAFIDIKEIAMPAAMLPAGIKSPLTFVNRDVALQQNPLRFYLAGDVEDIKCFWEQTDNAHLHAALTNGQGELPMIVNPMQFLMQHVLHGNCMIILKRPRCPDPAVPLEDFLRKIVPPSVAVLTATLPED